MPACVWRRMIQIALLCLLLAGCQPAQALPPTATSAPTLTASPTATATLPATATPNASPTLAASATPQPSPTAIPEQRARYRLDVTFTYATRSGQVVEWIEYTNNSADALPELRLMVPLYAYPQAIQVNGVFWYGGALDGQGVSGGMIEGAQIVIPLPQPLQSRQGVGLRLEYAFRLPSQAEVGGERPLPIGYTSRQANMVDWYPFVAPYRSGSGWLAHKPSFYGEYLVYDLADFEVNLQVTDHPGLTIAASAAGEQDGAWLRYRREAGRSFAIALSSEAQSTSETVDGVTVTSVYFPFHEQAGQRALQTTVQALELYTRLFGPYPHDTLAVVEADFLDGMEYDGLYFLSRAFYNLHQGQDGDYLVTIAAHETAHQWWYGKVANDQANEPWLDEALSTYCERLFYEEYYPAALDWWQQYRIDYEQPRGWVDASVYAPAGTLQTYKDYRNAVYLNGALFFEELRQEMGDDAFFAFLQDYAETYSGEIALRGDFFALLRQHTDAELGPLLQKYFANPPAP